MAEIFAYPPFGNFSLENNGNPINVYDDLTVQYTTTWTAVNLTLFCAANITYSSWGFYNMLDNPLPPNGSYHVGIIQAASLNINSYPSLCFLRLTKYGQNDKSQAGNAFTITSNPAKSTTFSPPPIQSTSPSMGVVGPSTRSTDPSSALSSITTISAFPGSTISVASSTSSGSTNLSTAAKAGIGVGVSIAGLIILVLVLVILGMRGRLSNVKVGPRGEHELPGTGAAASVHHISAFEVRDEKVHEGTESLGFAPKYELAGSEVHEMHDPEVRIPQLHD